MRRRDGMLDYWITGNKARRISGVQPRISLMDTDVSRKGLGAEEARGTGSPLPCPSHLPPSSDSGEARMGRGGFIFWWFDPGRRSPTHFALGYSHCTAFGVLGTGEREKFGRLAPRRAGLRAAPDKWTLTFRNGSEESMSERRRAIDCGCKKVCVIRIGGAPALRATFFRV